MALSLPLILSDRLSWVNIHSTPISHLLRQVLMNAAQVRSGDGGHEVRIMKAELLETTRDGQNVCALLFYEMAEFGERPVGNGTDVLRNILVPIFRQHG
jgi:hypothetical protein